LVVTALGYLLDPPQFRYFITAVLLLVNRFLLLTAWMLKLEDPPLDESDAIISHLMNDERLLALTISTDTLLRS